MIVSHFPKPFLNSLFHVLSVKLTILSFVPPRSLLRLLQWPDITVCWPPMTKLLAKYGENVLFMFYLQHLIKYLTPNGHSLNTVPIKKALRSKINSLGENYKVRMENKYKDILTILFWKIFPLLVLLSDTSSSDVLLTKCST